MPDQITYTEPQSKVAYDFGVWLKGKPVGRITTRGRKFYGYTNQREPGKALVGRFATRDAAGRAVADAYVAAKAGARR